MVLVALGKGTLHRVAAACNIRSILFHLAPTTAKRTFLREPGVGNVHRAKDSSVMSAFHIVHGDKKNGVSVYELASKELKVPLNRTLLVTEATLSEGSANGAISVALPTQSEDTEAQPFLARLATDLLNFDQCLDPAGRCFGPFRVLFSQVFYESALSFALVNLKPIVPGHVLVVPKRPVARFEMLDVDEVSDLWTAAQLVGKQVEQYYGASSLTFAIQDGKEAGQTVKHVHIHVIPRIAQDFERNDDIYTEIEKHGHALHVDNETRTARSKADMAAEAAQLRPLFCNHGMTITPDEAWGLACRRCDALVARHSQLSFVLENATGVHLTLDKTLLRYEQLGESWRVSSHSGVLPELQFTKIRTKNAFKRQRLPFELCCGHCNAKVASEGFLDELPDESMLLLDSKACSCVLDRKFPYGVAGGPTARKWGLLLKQLQEMKLPLKILKVQELVDVERVQNVPETEVLPVVHPTVTTIRGHFSPKAKMSKLRRYQVELTLSALLENTIVYLPTGCGKTLVAIKVLDEMKYLNPNKLVVFFVPTGPLVSQQAAYIRRESDFRVKELSGQHGRTAAATSDSITVGGDVDALVVTPQYFLNLLFNDRTKITDYSVMVFDEAHHATGNHPYCELLKRLATVDLRTRPHILALTASPFGEGVREMSGQTALNNLAQAFNAVVNAPTIAAEDLEASFIPKEAQWVTVEESEHERKLREGIKRYIESFYTQIRRLMNGQVMTFEANYDTDDMELSQFLAKLRILRLQAEKMARGANAAETTGVEQSKRQLSDLELVLKHLLKVASSFYNLSIHGAGTVAEALRRIFSELEYAESRKGKRTFVLVEPAYRAIMSPALINFPLETFTGTDISNRVHLVAECIRRAHFDHNSRAIVFVRRRKTAILLAKAMEALDVLCELNPTRFVGHNSYEGMSWEEEQRPTLDRFRQGRIRLLVATNVLEEGLDVPECSLVIQFDGVIGVTSLIQSRGRARHRDSSFIIFCSAVGKERNQRLVENEKRLVLMANMAASRLKSKAIVEELMGNYSEDVAVDSSVGTNGEISALTARATFDAMADKVYNIVLGGVFIGADKHLQQAILDRVSELASVRRVDEAIGLCTVAASPDQSIYSSYNSLCSGVEFFIQEQTFWMRFESDDMERAAGGEVAENIPNVGLRRGLMTPDGAFMELENFGNADRSPGDIEMAADALIADFGYRRVEFDLRALNEPLVWFDLTPSAGSAASVYLSFRLPPSCYIEDERECGDLDGDMFVVIWDKRLIPSRTQVHEPMAFDEDTGGDTSPRGEEYHQSTDDAGLVDFYIHSIQDDILGIASNAHLALCDSSNDGSLDENAKILARICSKQVDSLRAEKDLEIVRNLAPKSYPDFMQKKDKPSYPSKKILGKMYRRCKAIYDTTMTKGVSQMPIRDDHFLISGYTDYVEQAQLLYRQYKLRLRALLLMSGAQTEAELATGMIVEPQSEYKADYFRFGEQCKDAFYALQTAFRSQFDSDTSSLALGEKLKVAAACYFVTHDDSDATTRCLSFPWIVIDLLTTIKTNNAGRTHYKPWTPVRLSAYAQTIPKLQLCMLAEIVTNTEELLADLFDRLVAVTSLRSEMPGNLHKKEFDLILFGSSELLTFEKQSDLDVMVRCSSSRGSLEAIAKALERSHGNIDLKEGIRVPLLSFSFQQWSVEMCKFSAGPVKTRLFRSYMERHNFFWPCVYFLVRWGKCVGLIRRRSGGGLDMFSPTGFIWLFIRFCTEKNFVQPISAGTITVKEIIKENDIDSEISFWTKLLTRVVSGNEDASVLSAADVLLSFFAHYAKLSTPFSDYGFTDPLDPENDTQLEPEAVTLFRSECHIALHQLVIAQGDIKYLLTHREEQTSRITLSHALSTRIHEAKDFFSRKILFNAKAEGSTRLLFKLHPNLLRSDLYVAEIVGPGDAVQRIEDHIRMIEQELGARMPFRSNRNFHHEGSSLLLFEGAESQQEKIGFQDYFGERHGEHNNIRLHQAHLICFMNGRQWYEHAGATLCAKFIQQMIKLSRYEHLNPGVARAKAFVRFGHHYLINLPRSFDEETIMLASIKKLEDEFERGRTARELYESVLIAKQKQRAQAEIAEDNQKDMLPDAGNQNGEGVWGEYSDEEQEGWGGENDYMEEDGTGYGGGGGGGARQKRRLRPPRMKLQKAATIARGDKGATHSFYSMIERQHAPWTKEYAEKRLGMTLVEESDSYQVSIVHQSFEYNVRLTDDLQLVKISTRPSRWFSATLKMRQEMDDESHMMDSTPDVRFYVSTTEDMPKTDSLYVKLAECCKNATDGRGVIEFCDETRDKVRISRHLVDAGESPACIGTVRHVRGAKYSNSQTETHLSLMHIREFSIPDRNPEDGFMSVRDKVEAEFSLPTLTPERRLLPAFAREFLATGMEFVDFLRTQADMDMP
ncbi:hypothetical protein JG688_00011107 [Phytophthora aleatoria]|uniref:RNA-directed RNA polymerase n=1 Tax=Phytophthora aleatoria TaxID=2496075 RepID=A0A8J5MF79_9STRA|nr:hypothetical protein JG688_00011107 [Phytophthora aleatoria]